MSCGTGIAKFILIFFNILFWLSGACILAIGIWLRVDKDILDIFDIASVSPSGGQLNHAAYILIGFGAFVFIVGFLGCCGAWHMNRILLGLYIFFLVVVMVGELAAGILAAVLRNKLTTDLQDALKDKIVKDKFIEDPDSTPPKYTAFGASISAIQWRFKCCGVDSSADYLANGSYWPIAIHNVSRNYPYSCCKITATAKDIKKLDFNDVVNETACYEMNDMYFHKSGCYQSIEDDIKRHAKTLIGVGIGIAVLELMVLICAIYLCVVKSREKKGDIV